MNRPAYKAKWMQCEAKLKKEREKLRVIKKFLKEAQDRWNQEDHSIGYWKTQAEFYKNKSRELESCAITKTKKTITKLKKNQNLKNCGKMITQDGTESGNQTRGGRIK